MKHINRYIINFIHSLILRVKNVVLILYWLIKLDTSVSKLITKARCII
jgi:hypothetical protein